MMHDFLYCPRCARYSVVHWRRELGEWECEDCCYQFPIKEKPTWTIPTGLAS
jgi:transposase-like protein